MKARTEGWESELWSLIDIGDGINCPLYNSCRYKTNSTNRICIDTDYTDEMHEFIDSDSLLLSPSKNILKSLPECFTSSKIFGLVRKLARRYTEFIGIDEIPVPVDIINRASYDQPIEIRLVPLKSAHGAVWRLKDSWVIHLNSKDSTARRRFTLYHEIFHVLAHCNATPVFKKAPSQKEGSFNELLADHFSAVMIMPEEIIRKKWPDIKDMRKMAAIFDVPEPVMYCGLKHLRLI